MLFRGFRAAKILSQQSQAERSRRTQCPGEGSAPTRKRQAFRAGVQVGTPAGQPGLRIRPDYVPSRYKAKQTGLDRTLPAAYTGTHQGHTRGTLLSSYDHSSDKSTVSAGPRHRMRTALAEAAERADVPGELAEANEVAGACDTSDGARAPGAPSGCRTS